MKFFKRKLDHIQCFQPKCYRNSILTIFYEATKETIDQILKRSPLCFLKISQFSDKIERIILNKSPLCFLKVPQFSDGK